MQRPRGPLGDSVEPGRAGAWDIDLTTRSVLWSAGVEALLGLGDEFRGTYRRYLRAVVREDRRGLDNAVRRALRSEGRLFHQHRIVRGDGSLRHVAIVASLSGNLKGRPSRVAGVAMDVTDRERANSRLRLQLGQAQRMEAVAQLAGGIAHDFNNALMAIIGNVDMALGHLAQGGEASGEVTTALREIGDSARHASKLAARLLAFARRRRQ